MVATEPITMNGDPTVARCDDSANWYANPGNF
jgi:hypothetical protein